MKKIVVFMLVLAILFVSTGSVFAISVPGSVYDDQSGGGGMGQKKLPSQITMELNALGVKDVTVEHWASGSITALLQAGLMKLDKDGNFNPDTTLKAGEGVAVFVKVLGIASTNDSIEEAFNKAKNAGLVEPGMTMDQDMKRISVARLIAKALKIQSNSIFNRAQFPFIDFDKFNAQDRGIVKALNDRGIFVGYNEPGGKFSFRPDNILTKAEIAVLVDRLLGNVF